MTSGRKPRHAEVGECSGSSCTGESGTERHVREATMQLPSYRAGESLWDGLTELSRNRRNSTDFGDGGVAAAAGSCSGMYA